MGGTPPPPPGAPPAPPFGGNTPPPPPPGPAAQPYNAGPPPLDVGSAIGYGWDQFKAHTKDFVLLAIAVVAVQIGLQWFQWYASGGPDPATGTFSGGRLLLQFLISLGVVFANWVVGAGLWRAGLAVTRGQRPELSMLTQTDNIGPFLITSLLVSLGTAIGLLLCIIPGIIWMVLTFFAPLISLDTGSDAGTAIRKSIDWVKNDAGRVIPVVLVASILEGIGICLCGVGMLVTIPVGITALTYAYRVLNNEPVAR
ncbi:MAG: hypothetical protein ACKOYM_03735 [Actinomycetes bacterium]